MMTEPMQQQIAQQLSQVLDKKMNITSCQQVYGGDINTTYIINTNERKYFVKLNRSSFPDLFQKEYNGLLLLQNKSLLKVPQPIMYGNLATVDYLVMEWLEKEKHSPHTAKQFGEGLAALHRQTQPQFGLAEDNYIGSLPQPNKMTDTWTEFYATQRILPLFKKAIEKNLCTAKDVNKAELLCAKLINFFPEEPPALLHGDLWSGNVMACRNNEVAVYDPAAYFGHREMDIAMTLLFGGFDDLFYDAYNEAYLLQNGWQSRIELCQLYPLLVHLHLFGAGYYSRVKNILDRYK